MQILKLTDNKYYEYNIYIQKNISVVRDTYEKILQGARMNNKSGLQNAWAKKFAHAS